MENLTLEQLNKRIEQNRHMIAQLERDLRQPGLTNDERLDLEQDLHDQNDSLGHYNALLTELCNK